MLASGDGLLFEVVKGMIAELGCVDSENHALGTVRDGDFLAAIEPERSLGIGNEEGFGYELLAISNELKSGIESMVETSTRMIERRLSESMVLCDEGEANLVTRVGINVGRSVGKSAILADNDVDDLGSSRVESFLPEGFERMSLLLGIDREHHSLAAVTGLTAIEPFWIPRADFEPHNPPHGMFGVHRLETRIKAMAQLGARLVK